jgi:DNA polymerase I-like protein with 3'-5' exonuclease and polymerase domains
MSRLLFIGTADDTSYLSYLKSCAGTASIAASCAPVSTLVEVTSVVKKREFAGVLTSSLVILQKLIGAGTKISTAEASINNYAGSYFVHQNIPFVIMRPLAQLLSVPYGKFLAKRYITKLSSPESWPTTSKFNWRILNATNIEEAYRKLNDAYLIACDIETAKDPLRITCIGYTGVYKDGTSYSAVLPLDSTWAVSWMRKFNSLSPAKIFQNGKYDNAYLTAYNAPIYNWVWDTANLFHSWYSELPKDLGFLNAFLVLKAAYWKDLAQTDDLHTYYMYNALDTWATANAMLALLAEMPQWAMNNYANEFPLNFPCHLAEMTGVQRDMKELEIAAKEQETVISENNKSLDAMLGVTGFNTGSYKQKQQMLKILGCEDIAKKGTDEKALKKAASRHPLNARIMAQVIRVQKAKKLSTNYLTTGEKGKEYHGRILYALNPHGTDTSRLASTEHHFWCGLQFQNIPRGRSVKRTLIADDGFLFAECDLEQAESRDTAFIAGDEDLIRAVSGIKDFHSLNAAAFFGVPYVSIYNDETRKTIDVDRRDLSKKVNHGANYNMGAGVMVDTMGEETVLRAGRLLRLPIHWTAIKIAEYLLMVFHRTYPTLSEVYYPGIVSEIVASQMLTSRATHDSPYQAAAEGLVRYCFGDPVKNKRNKNAYIAHPPQSLNAMTLNKAFMRVFYEIAIHPDYKNNFKLIAQIHDSILFQFRIGHAYLCKMVKERMEVPVTVRGYDGKTRTFIVPAAIKAGKEGLGVRSWADI